MSEEMEEYKDSFTIGTPATGGALKVYLKDLTSEESLSKIDQTITIYNLIKQQKTLSEVLQNEKRI